MLNYLTMDSRLQKIKSFLSENKTIRQTIVKNTFWLSFSNIFGRIFRAIIIIYAARILGVENWGIFSYSLSIAGMLSLFMDFGINSTILKEFSRQTEEIKKKYLGTTLILKIILIILGILIIIFIAPYFIKIEASKKLMPFIALILAFDVLREFTFVISRSQEKMQIESFLYIFTNINILIFSFILLKMNPVIESFALGYVLGTMIGSIISLFIFRNYLIDTIKYFSKNLIKKIIFAAWPFALSGIFAMFLTNTDLFLIGWFLDARQVGIYAAGLRIIQLLYVLPSILTLSLLPVFIKLANKDNYKFKIILENGLKILSLIAFPLTIGGIILAKPIILFLFGKEYVSGASSFAILALTISIDFYVSILSNAIFAYDKQKYLSIYTGIGAIFNIIFDLILIPHYGIIGSAWATFFSQFISNVYLWKKMHKINPFTFWPIIQKGLFAAILMGGLSLILNFLNIQVLINIFISAIFYFIILYKIKEPIFQEIQTLKNNI